MKMTQCGKLFDELEGMHLETIKVTTKEKQDIMFTKAIIDFRRHILLGAKPVIEDNIECELIPMYNISKIGLIKTRGGQLDIDKTSISETEPDQTEEELHG
jgi:hypothetical protein